MAHANPVIGLVLLCITGGALAANPSHVNHEQNKGDRSAMPSVMVDGFGAAVSGNTLQHYVGAGLVQDTMTMTGAVTGNSATQVNTGANSITGDSFSGASGLPTVIQNTGNNVLIQDGVIVNVQLKP